MMFTGQATTGKPDRHCGGTYIVPFIMCVPFLIRFRQCITDHQPANALKYATAFPAIALSAVQRHVERGGTSHTSLHSLWYVNRRSGALVKSPTNNYEQPQKTRLLTHPSRILAVMINSLYSFYWDISRDWDLTLFTPSRNEPTQPFGLRKLRVFDSPSLYYIVIVIDLLLRCSWSMKLSVHLEHFNDIEGGIFMLEILEIFRRWMWVFFRVEAEWLRARASGDVLLDDLGPKIDGD